MVWTDTHAVSRQFPARYLAQSALTSYQIVSGAAGLSFGNAERLLQTVSQQLPLAQAAGYGRGPRAVTTVTNRPKARTAGTRIGGGSTRRATGAVGGDVEQRVRRAAGRAVSHQCRSPRARGRHRRSRRANEPTLSAVVGPCHRCEQAPGGALSTALPESARRSSGCAAPEAAAARGQSRSLKDHWLARTHTHNHT